MDGVTIADLTESERLVLDAYRSGAWLDADGLPPVRAEVIKSALLGAVSAEPGVAAAVRLRGARITGPLDLAGITIACPVRFESCEFDGSIWLADSVARSVRLTGCTFPGFDGTRVRVDGILELSGCVVASSVRLEHAKIDGSVDCTGLAVSGAVQMSGVQVTGTIDLTDARITAGLGIGNAVIGGRLVGRD
jgi:hypothetical protein